MVRQRVEFDSPETSEDTGEPLAPVARVDPRPMKDEDKFPTRRRIGDPRSSIAKIALDPEDVQNVISSIPEFKRLEMKNKGPIGFFENLSRKKANAIPLVGLVSTGRLHQAVTRLQQDQRGGGIEPNVFGLFRTNFAPERTQADKDADLATVQKYLDQVEEEAIRGVSIGGKIGSAAVEMPEFMITFLATGGVGSLAKRGIQKAAEKAASKATQTLAGKAALGVTKTAASASARTIAAPNLVGEAFAQRQIDSSLDVTDKGYVLLKEASEKPYTSLNRAFADTWIEMFSEQTGVVVGKGTGLIKRTFGAATGKAARGGPWRNFMLNLEDFFTGSETAKKVSSLWSQVGFNGLIAEMGEEQIGDLMRATFGLEDFNADNPEQLLDRIMASIHGVEELAVNAGVFSLVGGARTVPGAISLITKRKKELGYKEPTEPKRLSKQQIERIRQPDEVEGEAAKKEVNKAVEASVPRGTIKSKELDKTKKEKSAKISPERKLIVEGRLEKLNAEEVTLFGDIAKTEQALATAQTEGRSTTAIENRLTKLETRLDKINEEAGKLLTEAAPTVKARAKIQTTPQRVLSAVFQRVKSTKQLTKQEVAAAQSEVIKTIESSVSRADRGGFLRSVKNIQTQEQLAKALPAIQERIDALASSARKTRALNRVNRALKKTTPKLRSGRPVGKLSADVQRVLDDIRKASKIKAVDAFLETKAILDRAAGNPLSLEDAQRVSLLNNAADLSSKSAEQLEQLEENIKTLIATGRSEALAAAEAKQARRAKLIDQAINTIQGKKPVSPTAKPKTGIASSVKKALTTFGKSLSGWADVIDVISQDSDTKAFESDLSKITDTTQVEQKEKGDTFRDAQTLVNVGMETLGLRSEKALIRRLKQDAKREDRGIFTDASGQQVRLVVSKAEARKLWMELQDSTIRESIEIAEGGYQIDTTVIRGVTQEIQDNLFNSGFLEQEDFDFARAQLDLYQQLYSRINAQYRKDFAVDLPTNPFYSPITRVVSQEQVVDSFFDDQGYRRSVNPNFTKSRVRNLKLIRSQNDFDTYQRHVQEMSRYINWSDKLKDINTVFGNSEVRRLIEAKYGKDTQKVIDGFVTDFTNRRDQQTKLFESLLNNIRINFTTSVLALKPALAAKQMVSHLAFAETIPTKDYIIGALDFWRAPLKNWKTLKNNSDLLKTRAGTITRDIRDANISQPLAVFRKKPTLKNLLMITTRLGDEGAIVTGGWAVYRHKLRETGSQQQAIEAFEKATQRTQQSSDLSQLSEWQRGGATAKLFTMFTSSQNQYFRREMGAIRNFFKGRISAKDFAKNLLLYHVALPSLFQLVANFGRWDRDEQLRAAVLGSFNGMFLINDLLDSTVRFGLNAFTDADLKQFDQDLPIFAILNNIQKAFRLLADEDISAEDMVDAVKTLSGKAIGPALGLPVKQIIDSYDGVEDIAEGETGKGVLKLLGWSPYLVDKQLGEDDESFGNLGL